MTKTTRFVKNPLVTACDVERRIIDAQSALGKARERSGILLTSLRSGESASEAYMQNVVYQLDAAAREIETARNLATYFDRQYLGGDEIVTASARAASDVGRERGIADA